MEPRSGVHKRAKDEGEEGRDGQLCGQLGAKVGRHVIAVLGALPLHDQPLLGEHLAARIHYTALTAQRSPHR